MSSLSPLWPCLVHDCIPAQMTHILLHELAGYATDCKRTAKVLCMHQSSRKTLLSTRSTECL